MKVARDKNLKDNDVSKHNGSRMNDFDSSEEEIGNKGSYWTLSPTANDMFERGNYRRRRTRKQRHLLNTSRTTNTIEVRHN